MCTQHRVRSTRYLGRLVLVPLRHLPTGLISYWLRFVQVGSPVVFGHGPTKTHVFFGGGGGGGHFGIVQKVFSEKASAITRMRQKCVKNAPKWVLFDWEKRNVPKCVRNASNMCQKCAEHLWGRTPFGRCRSLLGGGSLKIERAQTTNRKPKPGYLDKAKLGGFIPCLFEVAS